ncbi:SGNH/GDSL hydrolase family protein [bacterium]|nr:SGNH/GDSL hydrolase family protein [bacterium]
MPRALPVVLAMLSLASTLTYAADPAPQFQSGDVVALIGDSITHGRKWHRYVYSYYLTRFPDRQVRFVNEGIAGDSAGGALRRLDWDILPNQPNAAVIFLGMNDVGRGYYKVNADERTIAARQTALDNYRKNMDELAAKLQAGGVKKLWFFTPSPYDDTAQLESENFPGVNGALAQCGRFGAELAAKYGGAVIDLNGPMTALNLEHQKADPKFTIIGPDRVHPGDVGMMVIAYTVLRAQGAPALVSKVSVDGPKVTADNATVTNLKQTPEGVSFDCLAKALPWPIEASAHAALALVPLEADLDQEKLMATLPAGEYRLLIEGQEVGRYDAAALAAGINLARNDKTPQYQQAWKLWQANEQRSALEVRIRTYAQIRTILVAGKVNEDDEAAVDACFASFLERVGESMRPYFSGQIKVYKATRPELASIRAQIDTLQQSLWQLNQPQTLHYELVRAQ